MCFSCWEEYGKPDIRSPRVQEAVLAIEAVYSFSSVGGGLHVVLDDFNIEDDHVDGSVANLYDPIWLQKSRDWYDPTPDQLTADRRCATLFYTLTQDERASALAQFFGYADK